MDNLEARLEALERERTAEKRALRLWKATAVLAAAGALCFGPLKPASTQTSSYTLTAPASATPGGSLSVSWTAPAGSSTTDWLGLYRAGEPNGSYGWWSYTGGATSGTRTLTAPTTP